MVHLELRTTPRDFPETGLTKEEYVETVLKAIETYERTTKSAMKTTLILSIDRRDSLEKAQQCLDLALRFKDRGVVGMDLCGDPWVRYHIPKPYSTWTKRGFFLSRKAISTVSATYLPKPKPLD